MKRIICYGDSNTWGHNPDGSGRYSEDIRWPGVAQKELGKDFLLLEESISGRTTTYDRGYDPDLNGLSSLSYALKTCCPLDGAVIMLGINDLTVHNAYMAKRGMAEIVRRMKYANEIYRYFPIFPNGARILLVAPPTLHPRMQHADPLSTSFAGKYEESLLLAPAAKAVAEEMGVEFLDAALYTEAAELDGLHLTVESHARLGKAIAEKLKEMFA